MSPRLVARHMSSGDWISTSGKHRLLLLRTDRGHPHQAARINGQLARLRV